MLFWLFPVSYWARPPTTFLTTIQQHQSCVSWRPCISASELQLSDHLTNRVGTIRYQSEHNFQHCVRQIKQLPTSWLCHDMYCGIGAHVWNRQNQNLNQSGRLAVSHFRSVRFEFWHCVSFKIIRNFTDFILCCSLFFSLLLFFLIMNWLNCCILRIWDNSD